MFDFVKQIGSKNEDHIKFNLKLIDLNHRPTVKSYYVYQSQSDAASSTYHQSALQSI